jgi:hypothetical protein
MKELTLDCSVAPAISRLAFNYFGDNIRVSFVGGSYAKIPSATSDVDIFVILGRVHTNDI